MTLSMFVGLSIIELFILYKNNVKEKYIERHSQKWMVLSICRPNH
jgi:hypothetical protein